MTSPRTNVPMAGRPPDVSDEDILQVFRQSGDRVLFTGEISDELPIGQSGVLKRLNELESKNIIKKKKRGNVIVWWLNEG